MEAQEFVEKWSKSILNEKASAQSFFDDLCRVVEHKTPAECDPDGEFFRYEKYVSKTFEGKGFVDVWYKGHFAWEHKSKHKDLDAAYKQLLEYREDLENPPLLVVSDFETIIVHTNFNNSPKNIFIIPLSELPRNLSILKALFFDPELLRNDLQIKSNTENWSKILGAIGGGLGMASIGAFIGMVVLLKIDSLGLRLCVGGSLGGLLGILDGWSIGTKAWAKTLGIFSIVFISGVVGGVVGLVISSSERVEPAVGGFIGGLLGIVAVFISIGLLKLVLQESVWDSMIESFVGPIVWSTLEGLFSGPLVKAILNMIILPSIGVMVGVFTGFTLTIRTVAAGSYQEKLYPALKWTQPR